MLRCMGANYFARKNVAPILLPYLQAKVRSRRPGGSTKMARDRGVRKEDVAELYVPDSSSSSSSKFSALSSSHSSQRLVLLVMLIFGNMFTRDCSSEVSKVRQTVVEV